MTVQEFCSLLKQTKEFDDLEIKIIQAMLNLENRGMDRTTAADIAKAASLSVTNAYKYLYSLQRKGIVEAMTEKNKKFWLARSSNPFPRLFSQVKKDLLHKKGLFNQLEELYKEFIDTDVVWFGEKMYEQYEGNFSNRASFLLDTAKDEILITTHEFYNDIALLDSIKRAVGKGIKIKIIAEQLHPDRVEGLKKIGIDLRLGRAWPYIIVIDGAHGITVDKSERGLWFLNCSTDYKKRFEEMWEKAEELSVPKK